MITAPRTSTRRLLSASAAALAFAVLVAPASPAGQAQPAEPAPETSAAAPAAPAPEPPIPTHTIVVRPPGAAARPLAPAEKIDLSLRQADLVEVLRTFSRLGGFNLIVDPAVEGTVTVELHDVEWPLALAAILRTHGLAAEIDGRIVAIRPLPGLAPR